MKRIFPQGKTTLKGNVLRLLSLGESLEQAYTKQHEPSTKEDSFGPLFRVQASIISTRRKHEVEGQKAMAVFESRHSRWKAGGPL